MIYSETFTFEKRYTAREKKKDKKKVEKKIKQEQKKSVAGIKRSPVELKL